MLRDSLSLFSISFTFFSSPAIWAFRYWFAGSSTKAELASCNFLWNSTWQPPAIFAGYPIIQRLNQTNVFVNPTRQNCGEEWWVASQGG
jgi:hypothetical protein